MLDRLIELLRVPIYPKEGADPAEVVADYLLDSDVIALPYKCGTVVYVVRSQTSNGKNLYMRQERIDHYRTFDNGTFMIFESGRCSVREDQWKSSVFATSEEAEQALLKQ